MEQKPFTEEQYQRCLKKAREISMAILDMRTQPLNTEILNKLYKAQIEFELVMTNVVNESCGL